MFNPELLIELVKQAKGNRTLNQFAKQCGVDAGTLSRIIANKNKQAPKPDTLKKIADQAYNNVTFNELMVAAGHIPEDENIKNDNNPVLSKKDEKDIEKRIEALRHDLINNPDGLMLSGQPISPEAIESLVDILALGIRQAKINNKKYTPKKYRK